jgi:hypothetical protein
MTRRWSWVAGSWTRAREKLGDCAWDLEYGEASALAIATERENWNHACSIILAPGLPRLLDASFEYKIAKHDDLELFNEVVKMV